MFKLIRNNCANCCSVSIEKAGYEGLKALCTGLWPGYLRLVYLHRTLIPQMVMIGAG